MCQRLSMPGAPPVPGVSKRASGAQPPSRAPVSAARCRRRTGVRAGRPGRSATTSGTALLRRISSTHHRISSARLGLTKVRRPGEKKDTNEVERHSYDEDRVPDGIIVPDNVSRKTHKRKRIVADYVDSNDYVPRDRRPEWDAVGLLGKVRVRDASPKNPRWIYIKTVNGKELWLIR